MNDPIWAARLHLKTGTLLSDDAIKDICRALLEAHNEAGDAIEALTGQREGRLLLMARAARVVNDQACEEIDRLELAVSSKVDPGEPGPVIFIDGIKVTP